MRKFLLAFAAASAVLMTGSLAPNSANAAPLSTPTGVGLALDGIQMTENVAWCFYPNGWNGPGFYRCGWHRRHGQGWHGARDSRHHSKRESRRGER
jgi:hypothetical protein